MVDTVLGVIPFQLLAIEIDAMMVMVVDLDQTNARDCRNESFAIGASSRTGHVGACRWSKGAARACNGFSLKQLRWRVRSVPRAWQVKASPRRVFEFVQIRLKLHSLNSSIGYLQSIGPCKPFVLRSVAWRDAVGVWHRGYFSRANVVVPVAIAATEVEEGKLTHRTPTNRWSLLCSGMQTFIPRHGSRGDLNCGDVASSGADCGRT